jgi:PAS domain S-box-containing protein
MKVDRRAPAPGEAGELAPETYRAFFVQSPFYAGIIAPDGVLLEANRVSLERAGFRREDVVGRKFWEAGWWQGAADSQRRIQAGFESVAAGGSYFAELPFHLADGTERISDIMMSPVVSDRGQVEFVMVTGTDITARVLADRELAVARQRLDSAMIAAELGTYEWDVGADWLYGDANFARMFSLNVNPTRGAPLQDYLAILHPDDVPRTLERIQHSISTGEDYETDYRIRRGDAYRWVTARGRMTRDENGRVVRFAGAVLDINDRKRAEEEQRVAAEQLQRQFRIYDTILSSTDDFAYIFDLEGRFRYANRRLLEVWARTLDQVVGKTCYDLGYPTWHADMHMREIAQVIATRRPIRGEVPFTGDSGISGVYDYIFTPVLGPDGAVESIAGTTRDVTERKQRETRDSLLIALDDATRPLTDSFEITQTSARLLGEALGVNRCAYADVEADRDTFNLTGDYNRDVPSIVGRYRFAGFGAECLRLMREGKPYVVEDAETDPRAAAVREAYRATHIRAVICVPLLKGNRFVAAMAVHQTSPRRWLPHEVDLVWRVASRCWESIERTRVQRVLAGSEHRLQLAVAAGKFGVWDLDLRTGEMTCSDVCKALYGHPAGKPFSFADLQAAVHPDDRARADAELARAAATRTTFEAEYQVIWPDRSVHWVSVRGEVAEAGDGGAERMVGVSQDITKSKQDEIELDVARHRLEEHARSLEASVAERTAKLQETIAELETFSYSISHDLRAPLRAMQSYASILAGECSDQLGNEGREYIRRIVAASDRMDRLIQDVLVYSRIARNEIPLEPVALEPFIAGILESYPQFSSATAEFTIVPPLGTVQANAAALTQVISNLLGNAIKFVAPGIKPAIRIWSEMHGDRRRLLVRDNGIGIDEKLHEKIFGMFYQADARRGGTGIGLSVVRKAAERMGGQVGLDSRPGEGSTFWVELIAACAP